VQQDANFNVTSVSNAAGATVERFRYTPYGQRTVLNDDFTADLDNTSDYSFDAGHQGLTHDAETQLVYNRARMLHPTLGRFISRDPRGGHVRARSLGGSEIGQMSSKKFRHTGKSFHSSAQIDIAEL